jgi:hypothetical protein
VVLERLEDPFVVERFHSGPAARTRLV